jgi:hypothetical protein
MIIGTQSERERAKKIKRILSEWRKKRKKKLLYIRREKIYKRLEMRRKEGKIVKFYVVLGFALINNHLPKQFSLFQKSPASI